MLYPLEPPLLRPWPYKESRLVLLSSSSSKERIRGASHLIHTSCRHSSVGRTFRVTLYVVRRPAGGHPSACFLGRTTYYLSCWAATPLPVLLGGNPCPGPYERTSSVHVVYTPFYVTSGDDTKFSHYLSVT
jgi:hypothetical protein